MMSNSCSSPILRIYYCLMLSALKQQNVSRKIFILPCRSVLAQSLKPAEDKLCDPLPPIPSEPME